MVETRTDQSGGVTLAHVTKRFEDVLAVSDLSLTVEPGELLVLLGPSGCGKTTTLRMVAGLEQATSGTISFGGDEVTHTPPQRRDVAMVFQNYALYPHETVRGNFEFPLRKMELDADERARRIENTAEMLDIEPLLEMKPAQLSGGQRQRVAVGRALVREPHVLCMDEPLSNLDAKLRVQTRAEFRKLQQKFDITTIYVTHDQEEAMSIADRIAIMDDGEIVQVGSPEEVYETPRNEFVASFLGDPPMNFVEAGSNGELGTISIPDSIGEGAERVGIRPEYIYATDADGDPLITDDHLTIEQPTPPQEFNVQLVEPVGRAYELQLKRDAVTLTARMRQLPAHLDEGETVSFVLDADRLQAFDEDGEAI